MLQLQQQLLQQLLAPGGARELPVRAPSVREVRTSSAKSWAACKAGQRAQTPAAEPIAAQRAGRAGQVQARARGRGEAAGGAPKARARPCARSRARPPSPRSSCARPPAQPEHHAPEHHRRRPCPSLPARTPRTNASSTHVSGGHGAGLRLRPQLARRAASTLCKDALRTRAAAHKRADGCGRCGDQSSGE